MPAQLTVPGLFVKWVVVPAALAVGGYFFVGPRLGKSAIRPTTEAESQQQAQPVTPPPGTQVPTDPAQAPTSPPRHHKRKKRRHVNPDDSVTAPDSPNFPQSQPPGSDTDGG